MNIPPWFIAWCEAGYIFHSIIDLLFIAFGFAIVGIVSRPGWRQHLCWASPAAAASILTGMDRSVRDLHHYLHFGAAINTDLTSDVLNYGANLVAFYSTFMLWRTLRDLAWPPAAPDPLVEHPAQPGVWPPAPTMRR